MKKRISVLLAVVLLLACVLTGIPQANAAQKATVKKTIGIVFDNSGSMYEDRYPLSRETMSCEDTPFTPDRYPFD